MEETNTVAGLFWGDQVKEKEEETFTVVKWLKHEKIDNYTLA